MRIRRIHVANYKAYRAPTTMDVKPLTVLIGRNHAGKSALLRAVPLVAQSLWSGEIAVAGVDENSVTLPFEAEGLWHGASIEEIIHGRHAAGHVEFGLTIEDGGREVKVNGRMQSLGTPRERPFHVVNRLEAGVHGEFYARFERPSLRLGDNIYQITAEPADLFPREVRLRFKHLLPYLDSEPALPDEIIRLFKRLQTVAGRIQYLQTQRSVPTGWESSSSREPPPNRMGVEGKEAAHIMEADEGIRTRVGEWFKENLHGVTPDIERHGTAFGVVVKGGHGGTTTVPLANAGHGISRLLPVVVQRFAAEHFGPGLDLVELPVSDLHPGAHAAVADLFVEGVERGRRDVIVETHSEMFLLRVRRRIAEERLDPEKVGIYWVDTHPEGGACLREIPVTERGEVEDWPYGVFYEDFEEVLAIRRASREAVTV